jgi:long-chain fatty acid transport protein
MKENSMKLQRYLIATLSIAICLSWSSQAEALIASVKSLGMAAAAIAYPLDAFAGAFNPAGQVEICDRVDAEITWGHNTGHARIRGNALDNIPFFSNPLSPGFVGGRINGRYTGMRTKSVYAPSFAINKRLGCCNEWAVGLIVYNRNFQKTTYNKPFVLLGTSHLGLEYLHETISGVLAYNINECHNIGVTLNYNVQRLKVNGLEKIDKAPSVLSPIGSVRPGHVTNKGYSWSTGWGVTFGYMWHITDCVTIGLTYQPETSMRRFHKYKGFLAHRGKLNIPPFYSGGISWRVWDCVTAAFDVQCYDWRHIKSLNNPLLHKGRIELLGSKNGPGFGFKAQVFYRFGVDWQVTDCWSVRAGYRYGNSPIRRTQTVVNLLSLDTVTQFLTLGTTYAFNPCWEASAFFAWGFKHKIKGKHSIPEGIPIALPGVQFGFGGGEADLTEEKFALGVAIGWNY